MLETLFPGPQQMCHVAYLLCTINRTGHVREFAKSLHAGTDIQETTEIQMTVKFRTGSTITLIFMLSWFPSTR
jgi:hypothetical protein